MIGFALQESLPNIFAGLTLSVGRPFKPGDWLFIDGQEGRVVESDWRSLRLLNRDNDCIHLPNSLVARSRVINYAQPAGLHLCRRNLGVELAAHPNKGRSVPVDMRNHTPGVLRDPAPEAVRILKGVDIFKALPEEDLLLLAEDLRSQPFAGDEVICRRGDSGGTFYLIKAGQVAVRVRGTDGVECEVARLKPGEFFGEVSLLTGDRRNSTCLAVGDTELLCLDRESFGVLLSENPPVAKMMSEVIAARSAVSQQKLAADRERLTNVRAKPIEAETGRILEKIWTLLGFRK